MKLTNQPVPTAELVRRVVLLEQLGFQHAITVQYIRRHGEGCGFVFNESFITSATDEEFDTAVAEVQAAEAEDGRTAPTAPSSSTVH